MLIVTDTHEIFRVAKKFRENLSKYSQRYSSVKIGYPSGSTQGNLQYLLPEDVWIYVSPKKEINYQPILFGEGAPSKCAMNNITVAINISTDGSARTQGALLKDSDEYHIAHTGTVNTRHGNKHNLKESRF